MKEFGQNVTAAGEKLLPVTAAITGLATAAVKTSADFDSSMSKVSAISGATGDDLEKLRDKAREMGETTQYSASDAADAMTYMAMAGWDTADMLSGLDGVMYLAAASGEDLATTSDIVTDALTAFGLSAEDSGHFADVLAAASSNANTNVSMMGETFKYCAPIAGSLGFTVEDTAEAIGLMANAGIKSSQAGTSLRTIMTNLTGTLKISGAAIGDVEIATTEADGSMRDLSEILADCREAFDGLSESEKSQAAETLVGKNAMSGFLALMNSGEGDINKLSSAIANCDGVSQSMAETMQDNLNGQITVLMSQLQELAISFGELLMPTIRNIVSAIQDLVDWLNQMDESQQQVIITVAAVAAALGPLLIIIGQITTGIGALMTAAPALGAAFAAIASPAGGIVLATAALAALTLAIIDTNDASVDYREEAARLTDAELENRDAVESLRESYDGLQSARRDTVSSINSETEHEQELWEELQNIVDENGRVQEGYENRAAFITSTLSSALGVEISATDGVIDNYRTLQTEVESLIEKKKAEAVVNAYQSEYTEAVKNSKAAQEELVTATVNAQDSTNRYNATLAEQTALQEEFNRLMKEYEQDGTNDALRDQLYDLSSQIANTGATLQGLKTHMEENNQTLLDAQIAVDDYNTTIARWEGASAAIISGDQQQISEALELLTSDFKTAETSTRASLEQQVQDYSTKLAEARDAVKAGAPGITEEYVTELGKMTTRAREELNKLPEDTGSYVGAAADTVSEKSADWEAAGQDVTAGLAEGIEGGKDGVNTAARTVADESIEELRTAYDSHSPSRVTEEIGADVDTGLSQGISAGSDDVKQSMTELAEGTVTEAEESLDSAKFNEIGNRIDEGIREGIENGRSAVIESVRQLCLDTVTAAKEELDIHSPSGAYEELGELSDEGYAEGVETNAKTVEDAVRETLTAAMETAADATESASDAMDDFGGAVKTSSGTAEKYSKKTKEAILDVWDNLEKSILDQIDLFSEMDDQTDASAEAYINRLQSQINATKEWSESIAQLAEKGINQGLLEQLAEMGPKGAAYVNTFLTMTEEELAQANTLFEESLTLPESTAESIMESYRAAGSAAAEGFSEGIAEGTELISAASGSMFESVDNALLTLKTSSGETIAEMVTSSEEAQQAILELQKGLEENVSSGIDLFEEFDASVDLSTEDLLENMRSQVEGVQEWAENLQKLAEAGIDQGLLQHLADMGPAGAGYVQVFAEMTNEQLQEANSLFAQTMTLPQSTAESIMRSYQTAGTMVPEGFSLGISENADAAAGAAGDVASGAAQAINDNLDIHSPSGVTEKSGQEFTAGFAQGIPEGISAVETAVKRVTDAATTELNTQLLQSTSATNQYTTEISGYWTTWCDTLVSEIKKALESISETTKSKMSDVESTVKNKANLILTDWKQKWLEIKQEHEKAMEEIADTSDEKMSLTETTVTEGMERIKEAVKTAAVEMVDGYREELSNLESVTEEGFEPAMQYIQDLIPKAREWAADFMDEYIDEIRDKIRELEGACEEVADTVSDYLHFSRPDKGPLREYEEWMPDMMKGLAEGIKNNRDLITDQLKGLTGDMSAVIGQGQQNPTINLTSTSYLILDGKQVAESVDEYLGVSYG